MEDNGFTLLCWFLLCINVNQPWMYICLLLLEPPILCRPSRLSEHWVELPESHSKFPLAICFTYNKVHISMLLSQYVPPSLSPTVSTVCSLCLHLYWCPTNGFISTIFLDSMYLCYIFCFCASTTLS